MSIPANAGEYPNPKFETDFNSIAPAGEYYLSFEPFACLYSGPRRNDKDEQFASFKDAQQAAASRLRVATDLVISLDPPADEDNGFSYRLV